MGFTKGHKGGNVGKGRKPGVPNKNTAAIKDMLREALEKAGGVRYLTDQAVLNPGPFLGLIGKLIPAEIHASLSGKDGGNIRIEVITGLPAADQEELKP